MAQIGRLGEYKPENESWSAYIERAELFMIANDVDDRTWSVHIWITTESGSACEAKG